MAYTSATTSHLASYAKTVTYKLELRTNFAQSSDWREYPFADFVLTCDANSPATLSVEMLNDELDFSNEQSVAIRTQLLAEVRLSATIANETEQLFYGRVYRVDPRDYGFTLVAQDWLALIQECECEVSLAPDETDEITPARQLSLVGGGAFGRTYGFSYTGSGDPAFNQDSNPGTRRRSWAPGDIRVWYDAAGDEEVPPQHYQVNLTSGTVTILEDTTGHSYYATGVRCYIEGTLDWAEVFKAALEYPLSAGGIGATASQLDCPDTGLDVAGPVYFQGRVGDLFKEVLARQQANLRLWYDSRQEKFKLRVVTQQPEGQEHWQLQHAVSISQPRDVRELYSRVVATGQCERPLNALADSGATISDITTQGDWFSWDGLNVGSDSSFSATSPLLYDGDANKGASVHNLAASEGGGSDQYDSWYSFIKIDLGSEQRLHRVRATMPGSRNVNAAAGHQGFFWPGVKLLGSLDDSDYRLVSADLCGRYPPHEMLEARGKEILYPKVRYLKVLLGAYKHGWENQQDPSIGLAELEVYTTEEYRVIKEIDGSAAPATYYDYTADYDRDGSIDQWQRNCPALWTRLASRHRTRFVDLSGNLNEFLAHDYALDLLAESVRLFQQVSYRAVCDPRVKLYDTVQVDDELNGDVGSILVERIMLKPAYTEVNGTNYLVCSLGSE